MALETGTYISDLVAANPDGASPKSSMDDHLRLIKSTLRNTFPNINGAMTAADEELNFSVGVTSAIQTQIGSKGATNGQVWTGTHQFPATTSGATAAFGASGMTLATLDFVNSVATNAALPGQAGKAGYSLLSNGTTANWSLNPGAGGAALADNVTLTASSPGAMTVTPTALGMCMTLPDATTCAKGVALFSAFNASDYDYGIKDSAGTQLGWIRPRSWANVGLSDSSTAAGVWLLGGVEKMGFTSALSNANITSGMTGALKIDATRTLLFNSTSTYAVVYDSSTQSFGAVTLLRGAVLQSFAILSAANKVLFVSCNSTTGLQAVVLTITGTSIALGTVASVTLAGNLSSFSFPGIIAVGASWCIGYMRATTTMAVRAISISGTTPTIGAESVLASTRLAQVPLLFASGSVLRTICGDYITALLMTVQPFTVSGSTLTPGAVATITFDGADTIRAVLNAQGRLVIIYAGPTAQYYQSTMATLSGTTETLTTGLSLGIYGNANLEYVPVGSNKVLISATTSGTTGTYLHSDSAGVQSLSTALTPYGAIYYVSGVTAKIYHTSIGLFSVDCSGATPVASAAITAVAKYGALGGMPGTSYGVRNPGLLLNGATAYTASSGSNLYIPGNIPYATIPFIGNGLSVNAQVVGSSDGWISSASLLQHVECVV